MHSQNGRSREDRRFSNPSSRSEHGPGRDDRFARGDMGRSGRGGPEDRSAGRMGEDRSAGRMGDDRGAGRWGDDRAEARWGTDRTEARWTNDRTEGGWQSADLGDDRGRDFARGPERGSERSSDRSSERSADRYSQSGYGNSDFGPGDRWIQDRGRGYGNEERYGQSYGQNRGIDDRTQNTWGRGEDKNPSYGGHGYGSEERHGQTYGQASRGSGRDEGSERGPGRFVDRADRAATGRGPWQQGHEGAYGSVSRGGFLLDQRGYGPDGYDSYDGYDNYGGAYTGGFSPGQREFSGRGPKGYVRSDERIREDVCERLSEGHLDASDIDVQVKDGEVTLSGLVSDRRTKRLVEELIDNIKGIKDVENRLKVRMATTRDTTKAEGQKPEGQKAGDLQRSSDNGKSDLQKMNNGARA